MKQKSIKLLSLLFAAFSGIAMLGSAPVFADDVCNSSAAQAVKDAAGCGKNGGNLPDVVVSILNAVIAIAGIIAVIFVIVGGVQYMTSSGDPGKTKKAKDTILYAVIGLVVCVLSFAIVNFVIANILKQ